MSSGHIRADRLITRTNMITGAELRRRVDRLDLTYAEAAKRLGLSLSGLNHQMRGDRPVSPQRKLF